VVVHELYESAPVAGAVRARFGEEVFAGEHVDRQALGARVFTASRIVTGSSSCCGHW